MNPTIEEAVEQATQKMREYFNKKAFVPKENDGVYKIILISLTESNAKLLEEAKCFVAARQADESLIKLLKQQLSELQNQNARLREALESINTYGHLRAHNHWDDTMQHGRGCPICIDQKIAFESLRKALSSTPSPSTTITKEDALEKVK